MTSKSKMAQMGQEQIWTFKDGKIEVATTQAGNTSTSTIDAPEGEWMTPGAAERYSREQMKAGAKEIVVKTMDIQMGPQIVTSTRTGFEPATLDIAGEKLDAIKTKVTLDTGGQKINSTEYIDSDGNLLRSVTSMGGMGGLEVIMTKTTKADATGKVGAAAIPEIMVSTFVKPDKTIKRARETTFGDYTLRVKAGELPKLPDTGAQRVTVLDKQSARLAISSETFAEAPADETAAKKFLASSAMLDTKDAEIRRFVDKALKGMNDATATDKALRLRTVVHDHIRAKNLGVGMATASETVRTREGDCSEHGVLLSAALRVAGIPARVATGLIYADEFLGGKDIFGYHMWSQALLPNAEGKPAWIDLDATLRDDRTFDATHITIAVTSLDDTEGMQSLLGIAGLMGNLEIEVNEVRHALPSAKDAKKGGS
jgi:hypothetical protein